LADQISYEAAQILFSALSKTDEPDKIKETILQQGVFKVLDNEIIIDKFGDPIRPIYVLVIKDQKIKTLSKIIPVKPEY
jgi:mRNA-degrading endonuclease HigB of HigAB toxin-antitoxin module